MALRALSRAVKQASLLHHKHTFSNATESFLSSQRPSHELWHLSQANSPFVISQQLHMTIPGSLPELYIPSHQHGDPCSSIDLFTLWRVSTGSSYFPPSSEMDEVLLPAQLEDTVSPMLMNTKRTFNPSTIVRKRRHGFLARKATVGGRRVLARRFAKGRRRLSA